MDRLLKLNKAVETAHKKMRMALERKWRIGDRVRFTLKHGQVRLSDGVVVGHSGNGKISVRMQTGTVKRVHFTQMYIIF